MSDNLDRRTVLKGVAVSAVALGAIAEAAADRGEALTYDEPKPFSYDLFKAQGARTRPCALCRRRRARRPRWCRRSITRNGARSNSASRTPCSATARAASHSRSSTSACSSRKRSTCMSSRAALAADRLRSGLFRHARRFGRAAIADGRGLRRAAASRRRATARSTGSKNDWVAFLGAAYFRAIGELRQYGLSARGVALDVAVADRAEEFPGLHQFLHRFASRATTSSRSTP